MRLSIKLGATVLITLLALIPACWTDASEKTTQHVSHAVDILQRQTDADALAAAALLSNSGPFGKHPEYASSLMARAVEAGPDRADLTLLQASMCRLPICDPRPIEFRLRVLDTLNGVGWLGELDRAWTAKDEKATNEALREIGRTDRVDVYYTSLIARLAPEISKTGSFSLSEGSVVVIGALASFTMTSYASVSHACEGVRLSQAEVVNLCQNVARALENGDTFLTQMIGVAIAKRVWEEGSPPRRAASDARRLYEYRSRVMSEIAPAANNREAGRYIALLSRYRREQDVFREQLIEAGKDPDPPAR